LQPDTRHRFVLDVDRPVQHVRLDVFPDGGMARLRLTGAPTERGRSSLLRRWFNALPADHAMTVFDNKAVVDARPLDADQPLPHVLSRLIR
jgi:allantoicase